MPPVLSPLWEITYPHPTPGSGPRCASRTTVVGPGAATPVKGTAGSDEVGAGTRPTISRGVRSTVPSRTGSNSTTAATTRTCAPVANASTGAASTRITSAQPPTGTTSARLSRTGVRPVTSTPSTTPTSTRTSREAAHVAPAEPPHAVRRSNAPVTGSAWASARVALVAPGAPTRSGQPRLSAGKKDR
jgi:hypothetical protein